MINKVTASIVKPSRIASYEVGEAHIMSDIVVNCKYSKTTEFIDLSTVMLRQHLVQRHCHLLHFDQPVVCACQILEINTTMERRI